MQNPLLAHVYHQSAMEQIAEKYRKNNRFPDRPDNTPDEITELKPDEVFVFGSNLKGHHRGGSALYASKHFGAKWGVGRGLSGQSYAIPTSRVPLDKIKVYVDEFLQFASDHQDLLFYVTKIGCGNAGYTVDDIAPLFANACKLDNVCLPAEFGATINIGFDPKLGTKAPQSVQLQNYGQVRTLADLTKVLNEQKHYTTPQELLFDLDALIFLYRKRGTVTDDAVDSFKYMLGKNASRWFTDGHFDIDKMFTHLQNEADNDATAAFELIYHRREMAKMARIVMLMNEIARYSDPQTLMMDIQKVLREEGAMRDTCHAVHWSDSYHYPYFFFEQGIMEQWKRIINKEGHLDNDRLERVIFGNHEKRIEKHGLEEVIRRDYVPDSFCHPDVYVPKKAGTGPIYIEHVDKVYVKSCGEGKGWNQFPEIYEMPFLTPILDRLCEGEQPEYIYIDGGYIPIRDYSRPVYGRTGKKRFKDEMQKKLFLMQKLKDYKAQQKND